MKIILNIISVFLLVWLSGCVVTENRLWPKISEFSATARMDELNGEVKFMIHSAAGQPLYVFVAHNNSAYEEYKKVMAGRGQCPVDDDNSYSGVLDCKLNTINESNLNLLQNSLTATRDWQSKGRFLRDEFIAIKNRGPSRVLLQRCLVRGMSIDIEINNVVVFENEIKSYDLTIRVKNDINAISEIANIESENCASPEK